jgi:3-epi-6-deoxocathasterone 23-monooxygenase
MKFKLLYQKKKKKKPEIYITNTSDPVILVLHQKVISETLRMANIINGVWRKALKDVEIKGQFCRGWQFSLRICRSFFNILCSTIAGYSIPQGWCVLASFISVHMDEDNYENPHQFDPWRWEVRI